MGRFEVDFLVSHDEASIVAELQRIAEVLGRRRITGRDIDQYGRISSRTVWQKFGTLRHAHEAAGLVPARFTKSTDEELIKVVADLWTITLREEGRRPRASEVQKYGFAVSARTITQRFGTWKRALAAAAAASEGEAVRVVAPVRVRKRRRPLAETKRFSVLKRDRYRCRICKKSGVVLEVDHIVPVSRGGADTMDNLQTLCVACNRSKGSQLM